MIGTSEGNLRFDSRLMGKHREIIGNPWKTREGSHHISTSQALALYPWLNMALENPIAISMLHFLKRNIIKY